MSGTGGPSLLTGTDRDPDPRTTGPTLEQEEVRNDVDESYFELHTLHKARTAIGST